MAKPQNKGQPKDRAAVALESKGRTEKVPKGLAMLRPEERSVAAKRPVWFFGPAEVRAEQ